PAQTSVKIIAVIAGVVALAANAAATGPGVKLQPTSLTFAQQVVGTTSAAKKVSLVNNGTSILTVSSIKASASFGVTNTCKGSVLPGSSCVLSVTFSPTTTGTITGKVTITDNALGSPQIVSLTGTAVNGSNV